MNHSTIEEVYTFVDPMPQGVEGPSLSAMEIPVLDLSSFDNAHIGSVQVLNNRYVAAHDPALVQEALLRCPPNTELRLVAHVKVKRYHNQHIIGNFICRDTNSFDSISMEYLRRITTQECYFPLFRDSKYSDNFMNLRITLTGGYHNGYDIFTNEDTQSFQISEPITLESIPHFTPLWMDILRESDKMSFKSARIAFCAFSLPTTIEV